MLGDGVKVMVVWLMRFYCLFNSFQIECPFVTFKCFNTLPHCNVIHFKCLSFELHVFKKFKVFCKWSFNVFSINKALS
jgi:hypothetical protein